MAGVQVGQVWASNDSRDVAADHNQFREVVAVEHGYAFLTSQSAKRKGAYGVRVNSRGIERHRLVRDA